MKRHRTNSATGKLEALPMAPPADDGDLSPSPPLQVSKSPAQPSPSRLPESPSLQEAAEQKRAEAWDLSAAPEFGDMVLLPWSHERHSLCARLIAADVPAQPLSELARLQALVAQTKGLADVEISRFVDLTAYLPTAEKVLYLAAHEPHEFAHVRSSLTRFFSAISDWSAENIPLDQREQACLAAHRIITQHESVLAMHAPRRGGKGSLKN